jgi:hypothetical protein
MYQIHYSLLHPELSWHWASYQEGEGYKKNEHNIQFHRRWCTHTLTHTHTHTHTHTYTQRDKCGRIVRISCYKNTEEGIKELLWEETWKVKRDLNMHC